MFLFFCSMRTGRGDTAPTPQGGGSLMGSTNYIFLHIF